MKNITKQQAVEIIKEAFDLKDFNNREMVNLFTVRMAKMFPSSLTKDSMTDSQ